MTSKTEILVSGITFIKNGLTLGYPIKESIESIDSLCDEIIVNVGFDNKDLTGDDGTYEYLKKHFQGEKYVFLKSWWDPEMTVGGKILAQQTQIAMDKAQGKYLQYIQGDECLHEDDINNIKKSIEKLESNPNLDGLVFKYNHFFGNTDIIKQTKKTYRQEVRLVRNGKNIKSWGDAQGFRHDDNKKLNCIYTEATVYHYGWARAEQVMHKKTQAFTKLYHGDKKQVEEFKYTRVWGLRPFKGTHPKVMDNWVKENKNDVDILNLKLNLSFSDIRLIASDTFEYLTGIRLGEYKNFNIDR
jgi:hypothetical protein